jgi:hypothetical protein
VVEPEVSFTINNSFHFPDIKPKNSINRISDIEALTSAELQLVVKQQVDIRTAFDKERVFYTLFRESGIKDSWRGALWINLLGAHELRQSHSSTFFAKLSEFDNQELAQIVEKDQIADRSDILVDKATGTYLKPNPEKIKKIILAYGNVDINLFYNQGYNFLLTLMLNYIEDEEDVFWCLHKLMLEQNWRLMYCNGMKRAAECQARVGVIFEKRFPDICQKIDQDLLFAVVQSINLNLIISVFTCKIPLEICKRVFEYFLYSNNGEECLLHLLESFLVRMRPKMLLMEEHELFTYLMEHQFVIDSFEEARGTPDWIKFFSYKSVYEH